MTAVQLDLFAAADPLDRLAAYWHEANRRWFGGVMKPVPIVAGLGKTKNTLGRWCGRQIEIHESLLDRIDRPGMWQEVTDVLLHEMIHQYLSIHLRDETWGEPAHGPTFTAWCNRIGASLGLPAVVARKPRGEDVPLSRYWPHGIRPASKPLLPPKFDKHLAMVAEWVRLGVGSGRGLPIDERLLAHHMEVSPVTVHRKLCVLERHGTVIRRDGRFWLPGMAAA